ncbi:MAG: hypothetical protein L0287_05725 [Anaerolineae bacterium]|nr:hypothetical protein [Anaerolineae bacterium]MCI0611193.1 hypothetical protein [Anaerolineae bacterium]
MQNKKLILVLVFIVLVVGAAAFIGGRFLNQNFSSTGSVSVTLIPAIELPITLPDVTGAFIERRDNIIIVETKSLGASAGTRSEGGPQIEVIITSETIIYRETTQLGEPLSGGNQTIQQTVEEAALDGINPQSMVMVWGRKSGDRIITVVLMYSDTVMIKRELFEDCEACP